MRTFVIVAASDGGEQLVPGAAWSVELVVAADGGLDLAEQHGLRASVVVGDMDSVSPGALARAHDQGSEVVVSSTDKDQTDLELALDAVERAGNGDAATRTLVLGGAGGRLDHLLGNVGAIASAASPTEGWIGTALVVPVRERWTHVLPAGLTVSLLAWGGDAVVTTLGLRWPLAAERLELGSARGMSNVADGGDVLISVTEGCVLLVLPEAEGAL